LSATGETSQTADERPTVVVRPAAGWRRLEFGVLWAYRELIYFLAWRDVKVRYKQTLLGAAWAVLQPTLMMVVLAAFIGRSTNPEKLGMPYPLFVFAGLLPWTFFATAVGNAANSLVNAERLITKIYFPRVIVPLASVGAALVDFLIAFVMLGVLMVFYGVPPAWSALMLPLLVLCLIAAALAAGMFLAALNVAYRDFRYVVTFLMQLWLFATPSVYLAYPSAETRGVTWPMLVNPMIGLIASFRAATFGGAFPWEMFGVSMTLILLVLVAAMFYFRRVEDSFADII
jgi:lipopolysaccharide transport system permease protein